MRTQILSLSLILILNGLIFSPQVFAMEYGDRVQTTGLFLTTWIANKFQVSLDTSVKPKMASVHIELAIASVPAMALSKKCGLAVAGAALTFWAVKKVINWVQPETEHGE